MIRFGPYRIDVQQRELHCGEQPLKIENIPLDILLLLIRERDRIVTREEIAEQVWGRDRHVEAADGINTAIRKIRRALDDDADGPGCIQTVIGRGYRFIGVVEDELVAAADAPLPARPAADAGSPGSRWIWVSLTAAALLLTAAAVWWLRPNQPAEEHGAEVLTGYAGSEGQPSFSPDGSKVVFSWNGERQDNLDIYVKQIGSAGPPLRLTTNSAAESGPSWSPDDRWIAFFRRTNGTMKLLLIPSLGGPEREVAELVSGVSWVSWTPDAKWLVFSAADVVDGPLNIWAVSVATGERRSLTTWPNPQGVGSGIKSIGDLWPAVAPDGRTLAFSRSKGSYVSEVYSMPLAMDLRPGGPPARIVDQLCPLVMGIAWTTDGRDLIYGCGTETAFGLWRTSTSGRSTPRHLTFALASAGFPSIARGTPRLAYSWSVSNTNLWRLDTRTKERRMLIGSSQGHNRMPQYSRDGRRIAFQSSRSGDAEVWTCDAEGTNCQQLTNFRGTQGGAARWSPDGHWLAFDSRAEGQAEIYVMQADGGAKRRLTSHQANDTSPSWSRDGRWIYFTSNRTGRHEIWKTPTEGGDTVQVTRAGGISVFESPDGRLLFYTKLLNDPKDTLFSMPVEGGEETNLAINIGHWATFGPTSKGIYFVHDRFSIRFLDFATGKVSTLAKSDKVMIGLTVSPDGAYVVVSQFDRSEQDLMLVENFR